MFVALLLTTVLLLATQYGTVCGCNVVGDLKVTDITADKASLTWSTNHRCTAMGTSLMYEVDLRQTNGKKWTNSSVPFFQTDFALTGTLSSSNF
ncbi:hypothetical protein BV898_19883 [Hypsibius exemplaris]|uniref:Fibronectin type-III domain-containing protein n=1 Tax=Hypsibius exemplaris TaxID=2072580 RepID=A0A9X6NJV6_HYPEX|nr:hypothetical protein BV898_19883 [Hypsibius exemplaris]